MERKKWRITVIIAVIVVMVCLVTTTFAAWDKTKDNYDLNFSVGDRLDLTISSQVNNPELNNKVLVPTDAVIKKSNEVTTLKLANLKLQLNSVSGSALDSKIMVKYGYTVKAGAVDLSTHYTITIMSGSNTVYKDIASSLLASAVGTDLEVNVALTTTDTAAIKAAGNKSLSINLIFEIVVTK